MNYWLMKTEPSEYGWSHFEAETVACWDGVRNYAARKHMNAMKIGDQVLFYHSVKNPGVIGTATVVKESYQDPTTEDERWVAVDIKIGEKLPRPVSLQEIKAEDRLKDMVLVNISRLSVQPVMKEEWDIVLEMGRG